MTKKIKIAIQGVRGSFHELAALKQFGQQTECMECVTFKDVFDKVANGEAEYGITAIENTVAGTILPNYAMLRNSNTSIIGEVYLHIQQNLLALKGQNIGDITEVHSHPMAILQCQKFFSLHPHIRLVEADDTAAVAKKISAKQLKNIGAIGGIHVAEIYGLQILAEAIETHAKNFTRFLVISPNTKGGNAGLEPHLTEQNMTAPSEGVNKSSLYFSVRHEKGSLAKVLTIIAKHDINLCKIQSSPIVGKEWEYYIHVDMEFEEYRKYKAALEKIQPLLSELRILGEYKQGVKEEPSSNLKVTNTILV